MREINFRYWNEQGKHYHYDQETVIECLKQQLTKIYDHESDGSRFEQYTGVCDKNGKEIYEGDIIQYKHYYAFRKWWNNLEEKPKLDAEFEQRKANPEIETSMVEYAQGRFCIAYPFTLRDIQCGSFIERGRGNSGDTEERAWDFEVIGNIHENPELMERMATI